jgi:hypothetical protein
VSYFLVSHRAWWRWDISAGAGAARVNLRGAVSAGLFPWCPGEIELRGRAGDRQDLLMIMTAAVLSLTVAALPVLGQQQLVRGRRPIPGML